MLDGYPRGLSESCSCPAARAHSRSRRPPAVVVVCLVARQFLFEPANRLPETTAETGESAGTEDQDDDHENDEKLGNPKTHGVRASAPSKFLRDQRHRRDRLWPLTSAIDGLTSSS